MLPTWFTLESLPFPKRMETIAKSLHEIKQVEREYVEKIQDVGDNVTYKNYCEAFITNNDILRNVLQRLDGKIPARDGQIDVPAVTKEDFTAKMILIERNTEDIIGDFCRRLVHFPRVQVYKRQILLRDSEMFILHREMTVVARQQELAFKPLKIIEKTIEEIIKEEQRLVQLHPQDKIKMRIRRKHHKEKKQQIQKIKYKERLEVSRAGQED